MNFSVTCTFLIYFLLTGLLHAQTANFEWVRHNAGTEGPIYVHKTRTDSQGNIYTIGNFNGDNGISHADFDPTDGVTQIDSLGSGDIYIQKLTSGGAFGWAKVVGGPDNEEVASYRESFLIDSGGKLVIAGSFQGTADFDSDPITTTDQLTSNGEYDSFVLKLAADGSLEWVKGFGNANSDDSPSMVLDSQGNIFVIGSFSGTIDFDPDNPATQHQVTSQSGSLDAFVLKLNTNGDVVWVKSFGGSSFDLIEYIVLDTQGNILVTGFFSDTVDFNPDPAITDNLQSNGNTDAYVLKLNSNGDFIWAKSYGNSGDENAPVIVLDTQDNVILTGSFSGTVDFNPDPNTQYLLTPVESDDAYILKLNSTGDFVWAQSFGNAEFDAPPVTVLDPQGNIHVSGQYRGTVDFDPDAVTQHELTSQSDSRDAYILKLASDGSFVWAHSFGNASNDFGPNVILDDQGNVIAAGRFSGTVDFDPDPDPNAEFELSSNGDADVYVLKLASSGDFVWAKSFGGTLREGIPNIVLAPQENLIVTGSFSGTVDFDPDEVHGDDTFTTGIRSSDGSDQTDVYVLKYSQPTLSAVTPNHPHKVVAYPNPSIADITIDFGVHQDSVHLRVFNIVGQLVDEARHKDVSQVLLPLQGASGMYWVEVTTRDRKEVFSVLKK